MSSEKICSICGQEYSEFGNNAQPINDGRCCDKCNKIVVIPQRLSELKQKNESGSLNMSIMTDFMKFIEVRTMNPEDLDFQVKEFMKSHNFSERDFISAAEEALDILLKRFKKENSQLLQTLKLNQENLESLSEEEFFQSLPINILVTTFKISKLILSVLTLTSENFSKYDIHEVISVISDIEHIFTYLREA